MTRILAVDDDKAILRLYQRLLPKEGYEVVTAGDGLEGVEKYCASPDFGTVITDIGMPRASGLYVIEEIRKINPDQRILVVASCSNEDLQRARELGISGFLAKPFGDGSSLVRLVKGL